MDTKVMFAGGHSTLVKGRPPSEVLGHIAGLDHPTMLCDPTGAVEDVAGAEGLVVMPRSVVALIPVPNRDEQALANGVLGPERQRVEAAAEGMPAEALKAVVKLAGREVGREKWAALRSALAEHGIEEDGSVKVLWDMDDGRHSLQMPADDDDVMQECVLLTDEADGFGEWVVARLDDGDRR